MSDQSLIARIISSTPLLYDGGAIAELDRPAHVRAASGIVWVNNYFAIVQDDANFVAIVDSTRKKVTAVTLPAGDGGKRQFDDGRGNKKFKMDLESCVLISHEKQELLITFGSGSNPYREKIVVLRNLKHTLQAEIYQASALYSDLRSAEEFAGSEMNIEGAVFLNGKIRLFNRGNGSSTEKLTPVNASCDIGWRDLYTYLMNLEGKPPLIENIVCYNLGNLDDLPLGFTDATDCQGKLFFSAAAEDSPDAQTDGRIAGSVLGVIDGKNKIRWTELIDKAGNRFRGKVEGITFLESYNKRAFVVVDQDSPDEPSQLCEVELVGDWLDYK
jgi:hypothetical protein